MANKPIIFLNQVRKVDLDLVGGKGANLGELLVSGFPVPDGFCITTEAFDEFIQQNRIGEFINSGENLNKLRDLIINGKISDYLKAEIAKYLSGFPPETPFCVRSSATTEDNPEASFAGQQDTFLNVIGLSDVLLSIKKCWASLYSERAVKYRAESGMSNVNSKMAVVVQIMVRSQVSGVMFTADPVSGNRTIIVIDAGFGLGEALVSGLIEPDSYVFDKLTGNIQSKKISTKKLMAVPDESGGTKIDSLSDEKSRTQALEDGLIKELASIGIQIEKHFGVPQDIEWCVESGKIYIVQSRPITTLFPPPSPPPKDNKIHTYVSVGHIQMNTDAMSPLGMDMITMVLRPVKTSLEKMRFDRIKRLAGRMFMDLSDAFSNRRITKMFAFAFSNIDEQVAIAAKELSEREDFQNRRYRGRFPFENIIRYLFKPLMKSVARFYFGDTSDTVKSATKVIENVFNSFRLGILNTEPGLQRLEAIFEHSMLITHVVGKIAHLLIPGIIALKRLESIEMKLFGSKVYSMEIAKGLEGNVTTQIGLELADIADLARNSKELVQALESKNFDSLKSLLESHHDFCKAWSSFLDRYGCRCAGEFDIAKTRWAEDPEPVANTILSIIKDKSAGQVREEFSKTVKTALEKADEFESLVLKKSGKRLSKTVKRLIKVARDSLPIREHPKYMLMQSIWLIKKEIHVLAKNLVEKGLLEVPQDVFYVSFLELHDSVKNGTNLIQKVNSRKSDYKWYRKLKPPRLITSDGERLVARGSKSDKDGLLSGTGVSSGVVEGLAKVVADPTKQVVEKGEILVAIQTDPGWTPLFVNASGLVTEVGGLLTHGSVVAREYGIPAVVGVENATTLIKNGQKIRVNGDNGTVEILS